MDGVVIYVAKDRSRAIVWCSDQGPLGLVRRSAMPLAPNPPLAVGDFVTFDSVDEGDIRICRDLNLVPGRSVPGLPDLLRGDAQVRRRRAAFTVIPGHAVQPAASREFAPGVHCA